MPDFRQIIAYCLLAIVVLLTIPLFIVPAIAPQVELGWFWTALGLAVGAIVFVFTVLISINAALAKRDRRLHPDAAEPRTTLRD